MVNLIEVLNGKLYQWDVGRQVKVDSDVCEVHFASCTSKDAYVTVPVMGTVYEEMTQAEIDELEKQQDLPHVPTLEERVEVLEECVTELERLVAELTAKPKPKPK